MMMLRMGKLADYATVIMTYMACKSGLVLSAQEVALAIGLELPTVSKILKILAQGKLLRSQRGSRGGYTLARTPEEISVAEIIDIMEGYPMGLTECSSVPGLCTRESACAVRGNWQQISLAIRDVLSNITLAELGRPISQTIDTQNIDASAIRHRVADKQSPAELQEMLVES
ncbi:MAG: SUF system Fe-S cluster assembly regulator [Methylotenera sp.]|nr:SUF system Fe-S cluster assembly regulator [Methylotenera sp.]